MASEQQVSRLRSEAKYADVSISGPARSGPPFSRVRRQVDGRKHNRHADWFVDGVYDGHRAAIDSNGRPTVETCIVAQRSRPDSHPHRRGQEPRRGPREAHGPPSFPHPEQQKEAIRRRAQGATLQELADSYDRSISTMRRATHAA
jgi:hypothetical protein